MARLEVRDATVESAMWLSENLREADVQECWAAAGHGPLEALLFSLKHSVEAHEAWINGRLVCMFGVGGHLCLSGHGSPWLLGTDEITRYPKLIAKTSREWIDNVRTRYDLLENWVDARNTVSVRWLGWLGFEVAPAVPHGAYGLPFHHVVLRGSWIREVAHV